jgi:hypothetical protein
VPALPARAGTAALPRLPAPLHLGAVTMEREPIEVVRRRALLEQIDEYQILRKTWPEGKFCGWAVIMLHDEIRKLIIRLDGMTGAW